MFAFDPRTSQGDDLLRTLAIRRMTSVVDEITERNKEIDMKSEEIRPRCQKYRCNNRYTTSKYLDNIKFNSRNKNTESLHNYFIASDIDGDNYREKDTIANILACELADDNIITLIDSEVLRDD